MRCGGKTLDAVPTHSGPGTRLYGFFLGGDDTCKHALPTNSVVRALGRAHHIWKIEKNTRQEEGTVI